MLRKQRQEVRAFRKLKILKLETGSAGASDKREMVLRVSRLGSKQSPIVREMKILCWKRTKPNVRRDRVLRLLVTFNEVRTKTREFQLPIIVDLHYSEGFTQIEVPSFSHGYAMKT